MCGFFRDYMDGREKGRFKNIGIITFVFETPLYEVVKRIGLIINKTVLKELLRLAV